MKRINYKLILSILTIALFGFLACSNNSSPENEIIQEEVTKSLISNTSSIEFENKESSYDIIITTNVDSWVISSSSTSWIQLSQTTGTSGSTEVKITALQNTSISERSATITINANEVSAVKITINQAGTPSTSGIYPDYNTNPIPADATGMSSSATELAAKISLGWNIGNTLEAIGSETAWGNPKVTKELIALVKENGFNAIRIPCSWNQYLSNSSTAEIKLDWLNRVKEVIQYCVDNEMYILVNIHWDGGWLENNVTEAKQEENNAKQKAFWEQIATHFRDFDEHLLFASANEPNVEDATQMNVLKSYHQTFIDAVRSTGGKNAYRTLVVQGPSTDIEKTNNLMTTLPTDTAENRMMVEVHYYTPYQFALMTEDATWGKMFYYWGANYHSLTDTTRNATWGEESDLENYFEMMKTQFVDKGIPVVLGEFAAIRRTNLTGDNLQLHLDSRAYYLNYVVKGAKANGLLPFYWDAGGLDNHGSGLFDRSNNTVFDNQALNAMIEGLN
ncbi:aryl-phospho-beta-D-glucosidase BglC (GH1 family) [Lutibacter oceani]|uniref:Aryl-phospho-beta-D-glucosidase BglC (GH1 family) n=1 Tax=Lutibacter oceani TaxID=1853311 RepID=A0A3D9RRI8_9FLAO|nr:cellulase family glycosylhydrolase [Lutibacter oceani]REE82108.1 aryl-phospho-beta-D-glucosidase BglC (GH1 family) [Lutibacter oceani]